MANPDFISDSEFKPDQGDSVLQTQSSPDFIPDKEFKADQPKANSDFIPDEQFQSDEDKYSAPSEQVKAGLEGAAQGVLGPLAPLAETKLLGVKPENIAGRAEANPFIHGASEATGLVGGMFIPIGQAGLIAKAVPEVAALGKIGSIALKGALEAGALQASDETSKYILGQQDPQAPVASALAHTGAAMLFGGAGGALFGTVGAATDRGLQALENAKMGDKAQAFLAGYGAASRGENVEVLAEGLSGRAKSMFITGAKINQKAPEYLAKKAVDRSTEIAGATVGTHFGGPVGTVAGYAIAKQLEKPLEAIIGKPVAGATRKYIMPILTKAMLSGETQGLGQALDYATKASKGAQSINNVVNSLFNIGGQSALNYEINDRRRNEIEKYIDKGGLQDELQQSLTGAQPEQQYAEGGPVQQSQPNHLANLLPDQNILVNQAKSRVYNYLNGLKPRPNQNKLPFDAEHEMKGQKRQYSNALDIATNPLSIMKHLKSGELSSEHVKHFMGMWPELHDELSKEITKRITDSQMKGEKPSYKVRQSLSMFMGAALESNFTPFNISQAQSVFAPKTPQQPAEGAPKMKRGTAKLGSKSNNLYQTADQDAEKDRSTRK